MSTGSANKNKLQINKNKTQTQIVLHHKNINNGDLSEHLNKGIKRQEKSPEIKNSSNFKQANLNSDNNFNKSTKIPTFTEKNEKEKNDFTNSMKSIKQAQETHEAKLKNIPFINKSIHLNLSNKLPKTIQEIEENEELTKLLLKNPDEMTGEEKVFISGFSSQEFKRFIKFLKIKNKELKWRGNDWGSGHYIEHYINIYRKSGITEEKKYLSLKRILKQNFKNSMTQKDFFKSENDNQTDAEGGDEKDGGNFPKLKETLFKIDTSLERGTNMANAALQNNLFEQTSKTVFKELENFKNTLLNHKNELNYKKIETQNNIIFKDLESKSKFMKDDVTKLKNIKMDAKPEIDNLIENFQNSMKQFSEKVSTLVEESNIINKIKAYCDRMNLTAIDLIKKLDHNSFLEYEVNLENLQESFLRFKILDREDSEEFCKMLSTYYGKKIKIDYLVKVLEVETGDLNYYNQILQTDNDKEKRNALTDSEEENDYDYFNSDNHINKTESTKQINEGDMTINRILGIRNYPAFEFLMQKKSAIFIQKCFRAYVSRRKYKHYSIRLSLMSMRISKALRKYMNKVRTLKNESAAKITYLMRKNYIHKYKSKQLHLSTDKLFGKVTDLPFSRKNKLRKIISIQRAFRKHKERIMKKFFEKNSTKMDINMLKTKTCFSCMINRVTHLCRDCEDNHYCEHCFMKFHSRGTKRNHSYLKISAMMEDIKKKKEQITMLSGTYNEIAIIKNYLLQNSFNLYELFKLWDFNKNNTILYRHYKDALMVRGIKFDPYIRDLLINLALRYIMEDKTKDKEKFDNFYVNYESLCLEFV